MVDKYGLILGAACILIGGLLFAGIAWAMGRISKLEFMKLIVCFLLTNAVVWVYLSYGLAFMDRIQIAEELSKTALTVIIAVVFTYACKSLSENLSKNNVWPDKPVSQAEFYANEPEKGGARNV